MKRIFNPDSTVLAAHSLDGDKLLYRIMALVRILRLLPLDGTATATTAIRKLFAIA